ncbi:lipocalin family protein [Hymenobacter sp. GOD-10R]|uniref:lipocalin family protein n=1 Tax=Hymenobacter sp. GOD-10R TaxID=3093922 RepID=UPI002D79FF5F|nr:lipocalin family protein [Hymenobacter sp. GOD-10R]WRQ31059.1 lipocalin family protein [Hymenobacter sp. GOD-10R]
MNKFSITLCTLLAIPFALSSCDTNKDKEDVKPATKTEMLTDKNWMLSALTTTPARTLGGKQVTDLFPYVDECTLDDVLNFAKPNVYRFDEGTTRCSAQDQQSLTGTWAFREEESVLATQFPGYQENTYNVLELNNNTLKMKTQTTINGVKYTETYTYTKH